MHAVLLEDSNESTQIDREEFLLPSVRGKDQWNELDLEQRQGLVRLHHFDWSDVQDACSFIRHVREVLAQDTFIIPHSLATRINLKRFIQAGQHEEMLIDLRDDISMSDLKNNTSRVSLSSELAIMKQRPEICSQVVTYSSSKPSLIHLLA